ncbi:N-acyl-D-amino-acid deacylase family protein [Marinactinospora thermotolerans]|uniref:Dihydroorotase n=1 Tax=Marinactinospora thermotolerans DSM 45154 TaxID=1122192 RepID=A0A1T4SDK4_9ACTN|nr:D-aminoacylase [Marinactinospora thermotolerans]SKA25958.1 dihydroorotase [Marinactinospora thermotolerans DSM 45154]
MDILITNATVIDGTGAPGYPADVEIDNGRITGIHPVSPGHRGPARRVIDADGLALSPGFIDMHAHSDLQILANPDHTAKVTQGVTCEVLGQDGLSFAPIDDTALPAIRQQIAGWNGEPDDFDFSWRTVAGYLDRLDQGIACNACYLVPQGTVRMLVVGPDARPATAEEVARMREIVATGMREGAVGMSSGLTYTPGMYADDGELTELCRAVAEWGGFYAPHHRSYGAGALDAYAEMIDVARRSGCSLHLAHATMNFEPNRGRAGELLELLDAALDEGVDISLDTYPYLPGSTTLAAILPSWAFSGGPGELLRRLATPQDRARIRHEMEHEGTDGCHGVVVDWNTIQISGVRNPELGDRVGRTIAELARESGSDPTEFYFDHLIADNLATTILQHVGHEENVQTIMRHRAHTGGSDGILVGDLPHPRAWGTFPRYLARYVRELGILGLEECVHHLTGRAAARLGLRDRGVVRVGNHADLVLFDPDTVRDEATFDAPRRPATGIPYVFVNGVAVVEEGERTEALPGRALRRTAEGTRAL